MELTVKLRVTGIKVNRGCFVCDVQMDDLANAEVYRDGESTGLVVCPQCLRLTSERLAAKARDRAQRLREAASELEGFAADLPVLPTVDEWSQACRQAEARRGALEQAMLTDGSQGNRSTLH